jgi:hypothetical protein
MFTIAAGVILAILILTDADTIVLVIGVVLLSAIILLAADGGAVLWGGPARVSGMIGVGLGFCYGRRIRKLHQNASLTAGQHFLGLLVATLILGIPAVAALCWTAALLW